MPEAVVLESQNKISRNNSNIESSINRKDSAGRDVTFSKKIEEKLIEKLKSKIERKDGKLQEIVLTLLKSKNIKASKAEIQKLISLLKKVFKAKETDNKEIKDVFLIFIKKIINSNKEDIFNSDIFSFLKLNAEQEYNLSSIKNMVAEIEKQEKKNNTGKLKKTLPKLIVIDLREKIMEDSSKEQFEAKMQQNASIKLNTGSLIKKSGQDFSSDSMLYYSFSGNNNFHADQDGSYNANKSASMFNQKIAEKLKWQLKNDIVKNTKVIVKEGGKGEIRILLKPESLGRIRMRVNLENNHIDGKIFVENNSVREIVEDALEDLNSALKKEGYQSVSLKVSVGSGNRENRGDSWEASPKMEVTANSTDATSEFEKNIPVFFDIGFESVKVNLFI